MPPRRRVDPATGLTAVRAWQADPGAVGREVLKPAVLFTLEELAARFPGNSTEVRVPPFAAVQCLPGPRHTRGTPPNVVETDAATWLRMATGQTSWQEESDAGRVRASGERSDLSGLLPLRHLFLLG
ncbi:MAG: sterol carrier family protein [Kineosporiaceae bacterium]